VPLRALPIYGTLYCLNIELALMILRPQGICRNGELSGRNFAWRLNRLERKPGICDSADQRRFTRHFETANQPV
jgi:hypothetical protein